jgi:hypothetical protein
LTTAISSQALDMLLDGRMADAAVKRDWPMLHEIARLAKEGPPAGTDPALAEAWRTAIEKYKASGWEHMTPERVRVVAPPEAFPDSVMARIRTLEDDTGA